MSDLSDRHVSSDGAVTREMDADAAVPAQIFLPDGTVLTFSHDDGSDLSGIGDLDVEMGHPEQHADAAEDDDLDGIEWVIQPVGEG